MDTKDQAEKGLKLRKELFGEKAVAERMNAFGEFGEPLQHIINAYSYGDVWSRNAVSLGVKSLAMIAMMAAANRPMLARRSFRATAISMRRRSVRSWKWRMRPMRTPVWSDRGATG